MSNHHDVISRNFPSARSHRFTLSCHFLAMVLLSSGCKRSEAPPPPDDPPAPVKWEEPRKILPEEWTELVGTTQPLPDHAARVTSPVSGRVLAVLPKHGDKAPIEGQSVEEGEVLVQLDAAAIQANLAKAEAAKKVLQADREVAVLAHKQAELDYKSLEELKRNQTSERVLVTPIALEKGKLALDSAQAMLFSLDRKLEAADKETASIAVELKLYTLAAPRKGRLGRIQVVVGQTLAAGAPVAELVNIGEEIDVLCFVSASDVRKLKVDQPAHIGGIDKKTHNASGPEGKVVYIADQAEPETGSYAVKVRFPNNDLKLRASAVTRVRILTKKADDERFTVLESALMEDQDPPSIAIVEDVVVKTIDGKEVQTGKIRRLRAEIGIRDRVLGQVEILRLEDPDKKWKGDFNEHTLIVIAKGQGLQTGDLVKLDDDDDDDAPKP